jgi:hypothetical protein
MDERKARTDEKGGTWGRACPVGGARTLSGEARTPGGGACTLGAHTPSGEGAHAWERARLRRGAHAWWGGTHA